MHACLDITPDMIRTILPPPLFPFILPPSWLPWREGFLRQRREGREGSFLLPRGEERESPLLASSSLLWLLSPRILDAFPLQKEIAPKHQLEIHHVAHSRLNRRSHEPLPTLQRGAEGVSRLNLAWENKTVTSI